MRIGNYQTCFVVARNVVGFVGTNFVLKFYLPLLQVIRIFSFIFFFSILQEVVAAQFDKRVYGRQKFVEAQPDTIVKLLRFIDYK